jgi:hypothetical protein
MAREEDRLVAVANIAGGESATVVATVASDSESDAKKMHREPESVGPTTAQPTRRRFG